MYKQTFFIWYFFPFERLVWLTFVVKCLKTQTNKFTMFAIHISTFISDRHTNSTAEYYAYIVLIQAGNK